MLNRVLLCCSRRGVTRMAALAATGNMTMWLLAWLLHAHVQPVSRRACNAAYIVWTLALNLSMLLLFACVDAQHAQRARPSSLSGGDDPLLTCKYWDLSAGIA